MFFTMVSVKERVMLYQQYGVCLSKRPVLRFDYRPLSYKIKRGLTFCQCYMVDILEKRLVAYSRKHGYKTIVSESRKVHQWVYCETCQLKKIAIPLPWDDGY